MGKKKGSPPVAVSGGSTSAPATAPRTSCHVPLLNLPVDLYRESLSYLSLLDLRRLGYALLYSQQMKDLYLLSLRGTVLAEFSQEELYNIDWLLEHDILVRKVDLVNLASSLDTKKKIFQLIAQSKPCLEILKIQSSINSRDIRSIGSCPKLKFISLHLNQTIPASGLESFLRMNHQLQRLSLRDYWKSDELLEIICQACPRLQHLDLSFCTWITDASLDLIEKSSLKLTTLMIAAISSKKIREFIEKPFLPYLFCTPDTPELTLLLFQKFTLSAIQDPDLQVQFTGLKSFQTIFPRVVSTDSSETLLRVIPFLSPTYEHVSALLIFPDLIIT